MRTASLKRNLIWIVVSLMCYGVSYWLCRYVFYELHYMKQWSFTLFIFGLIVLFIALILKKRGLIVMIIVAYIGGFALGMIFNTTRIDEVQQINNAWLIWTVSFLISMAIGITIDIILKVRKCKIS